MRLDEAIRRRGFRRWYERQLYEAYAYLVTGLLALIMMAIALEVIAFRQSVAGFLALLCVGAIGGATCVFSWRRFTTMLGFAEYIAEQAVCPSCRVYRAVRHRPCRLCAGFGLRLHARGPLPRLRPRVEHPLTYAGRAPTSA